MKNKSIYRYMVLCITMVKTDLRKVNGLLGYDFFNRQSEAKKYIENSMKSDRMIRTQKFRYHTLKFKIN